MSTMTDYLKRQNFNVTVQVLLYPYTGTYDPGTLLLLWDDPVDITDYCLDLDIDFSEGVLDLSGGGGGQLTDKIVLKLDNSRGDFSYNGRIFSGNVLNNSKVVITATYKTFEPDSNGVLVGTTIGSYVFYGLLKADSSSYSVTDRTFLAGILSPANILNGIFATIIGGANFLDESIYNLLRRSDDGTFVNVTTIKSILNLDLAKMTFGVGSVYWTAYDSGITISGNVPILKLINDICFATNSVWRIDQNKYFIIEPINNTGTSKWDLTLDDIISIDDLGFLPLQFTNLTWDDGVSAPFTSVMSDANRYTYGYDKYASKITLSCFPIYPDTTRQTILDAVLAQVQHRHRVITLTTKTNPELQTNEIITIDHPAQAGINNLVISPTIKWRVLTIRRKLNLAPDMQIVAVQAGTGSDANLDGT